MNGQRKGMDMEQEFAEVELDTNAGRLVALARPGVGVPVVVVHGVMADAFAWRAVASAVAPGRPVIVINRRGRAPSTPLGDGYGVDAEVADLVAWLDTIESPVDLVAHSYGGLVATEAVRRGARVRSLVLYEPVARPFGVDVMPRVIASVESGDLDAAVEIINVDLSGYSREHVEALRSSPSWAKLRALAAPAGAELAAINGFDFAAPDSWSTPTTLIAGELSRHRPPYGPSVEIYRKALGLDEVVILDGQDHIAHVTAPLDLARAMSQAVAE